MQFARWRCLFAAGSVVVALATVTSAADQGRDPFASAPEFRLAAADEKPADAKPEDKPATETTTETTEVVNEDDLTLKQSFDAYIALEDGQPGRPGEIELNYSTGWQTRDRASDPWLMAPEIAWTPKQLPNTRLSLAVPLELLNGRVDGNADIYLRWLQRWIQEKPDCWYPTFSTINELRVPSGYGSEGVDWTLTGVLAKEIGPGTAYFNMFLRTANGENDLDSIAQSAGFLGNRGYDATNRRHFQWGFRTGYKWRITECFAIIADYTHQSNQVYGSRNQHIGEVAAEWRITDKLTLGPGLFHSFDGQGKNTNFGMGVKLHYAIN